MANAPQNFNYNSSTQILSWDAVAGATGYDIQFKLITASNWEAQESLTNSMPFDQPSGTYDIKGKSKTGGSGEWGPEEQITV